MEEPPEEALAVLRDALEMKRSWCGSTRRGALVAAVLTTGQVMVHYSDGLACGVDKFGISDPGAFWNRAPTPRE